MTKITEFLKSWHKEKLAETFNEDPEHYNEQIEEYSRRIEEGETDLIDQRDLTVAAKEAAAELKKNKPSGP